VVLQRFLSCTPDYAKDVRIVGLSSSVYSDARSRSGVRNGRLWEACVAGFQEVFGMVTVSDSQFHYFQAELKRVNRLGLKKVYQNRDNIIDVIRCIPGLPLLLAANIPTGL